MWPSAVLLWLLLFAASAPARAAETLAADLREEVQRVAVRVKDGDGREEARQIPITFYRPRGPGPFPLVILNHGRPKQALRASMERQRFEGMARYLVGRGFAVFVPTRVGYGENYGEFDPEGGYCDAPRLGPMAMASSEQVLSTLDFAKSLPFVDARRWVVMGESVGGFASAATVSRNPPGLVGGINFAGGVGGDPDSRPGRPCAAGQLEWAWRAQAGGAVAPMLWLYWENDMYWGADMPKRWHRAWLDGGGHAEFHLLKAIGTDGHDGVALDAAHWVPIVETFLAKHGFDAPRTTWVRPGATGFAAIEQIDKVPVDARGREDGYRKFLAAKFPRAYAVGHDGAWGWASGPLAIAQAIDFCQRRGSVCRLYAVDDEVVWTR